MSNEVRLPDIEIIVGCAQDEVATFCFYLSENVHQGYNVVCAIADQDAKPVIRQILQDAITSLDQSHWFTLDELHSEPVSGEGDQPF